MSVHFMLARNLHIPELELTDQEAKQLAEKICQVQQVFDVNVSPKTKAVVELAIVMGTVYGTRGVSAWLRMKEEAKSAKTTARQAPHLSTVQ